METDQQLETGFITTNGTQRCSECGATLYNQQTCQVTFIRCSFGKLRTQLMEQCII